MDEAAGEVSQIKQELVDPRSISKKHDPEGRSATVEKVLEARARVRSTREGITEKESQLDLVGTNITQRTESVLVKLKEKIGIKDRDLAILRTESSGLQRELELLKAKLPTVPDAKVLLESYYEKVQTLPLTNQEKRELLTPEALASLSTEEYIALWRRLNPQFLSHVTRQGLRDHTGDDIMVQHNSGYGEFTNGFIDVMQNSRRLFPPLAKIGLVDRDEATVKSFLSPFLKNAPNAEKAEEMFLNFLTRHNAKAPKYPDVTATHFAAQMVSDRYYGGETANEVFFVYPSDIMASQYTFAFNGWEKDFTQPQSESKWNDVFVWTGDLNKPGVPVDMGIVFLPETVPVDPETGSKYASEIKIVDGQEKRVMIENTSLINSFVEWGKKLNDQSPVKQAFTAYKEERGYWKQEDLKGDYFIACSKELQDLGFSAVTSRGLANKLIEEMYVRESFDEEALKGIIEISGAHLKQAESTVPAKEYWESYFVKNPHLRPKHVQYYDADPTTAVFEFQQQNNIGRADTSKTDGQLLGFDDNHVLDMEKDPRANAGYDDLVATADKIITEHYKTPIPATVS